MSRCNAIFPSMSRDLKSQSKPEVINKAETIGARVAQIRKERGMTQTELAEKIGIIQALISDYERGKLRLYDDVIIRLATALGVSTDTLLGVTDKDSETPQISLRFLKRLSVIETFPEAQKKRILRNLDDAINTHAKKPESEPQSTDTEAPAE